MSNLYVPGVTAWEHYDKVVDLVDSGAQVAADHYLAELLATEGKPLYEEVCDKIARHYNIPPKDIRRR